MDILSQAVLLAAKRKAMGGEQPQPMPEPLPEPNGYTVKQTDQMASRMQPVDDFAAMAKRDGINPDGTRMAEVRSTGPGGSRDPFAGQKDTFEGRAAQGVYDGTVAQVVDFPHSVGKSGRNLYEDYNAGKAVDPMDVGIVAAGALPVLSHLPRAAQSAAVAGGSAGAAYAMAPGEARADLSASDQARRSDIERRLAIKDTKHPEYMKPTARAAAVESLKALDAKDAADSSERRKFELENASKAADEKSSADKTATANGLEAYKQANNPDNKNLRDTPFAETMMGRVPGLVSTAGIAAVTGALAGGVKTRGINRAAKEWGNTIKRADAPDVLPSAKFAANAESQGFAKDTFGKGWDNTAPVVGGAAALGAAEGLASSGIENYWDKQLPAVNDKRKAWDAYLEQLPADHPDRKRIEGLRDGAGAEGHNPAREHAMARSGSDLVVEALQRAGVGAVASGIGSKLATLPMVTKMDLPRNAAARLNGEVGEDAAKTATNMKALQAVDENYATSQRTRDLKRAQSEKETALARSALDQPSLTPELQQRATEAVNEGALRRLQSLPRQDQPLLPAPVESPLPASLPGADKNSAPALPPPQNVSAEGINQAALEYKPVAPDAVAAMRDAPSPREPLNRDDLAAVLSALQGAQPAAKGPIRNGANPGTWAENIAPTARQALEKHFDDGGNFKRGVGAKLSRDIDRELPAAVKRPSTSDVNDRIATMKDILGDSPSKAQIVKLLSDAPQSIYKGRKVFSAAPLAAASGAASQSEDPHIAVARALMGY